MQENERGFGLIGILIVIVLIGLAIFSISALRGSDDDATKTQGESAIQQAEDLSDQIKTR